MLRKSRMIRELTREFWKGAKNYYLQWFNLLNKTNAKSFAFLRKSMRIQIRSNKKLKIQFVYKMFVMHEIKQALT